MAVTMCPPLSFCAGTEDRSGVDLTDRRIVAVMVAYNEADRYLERCLDWLRRTTDEIFLLDDRSTDATPFIARQAGCQVMVREPGCPGFLDDESAFRQQAWFCMAATLEPSTRDWIVSLDADEFLVADPRQGERDTLLRNVETAEFAHRSTLTLPVAEVFSETADAVPLVRGDGHWGALRACRAARYDRTARFDRKTLAGGSVPSVPGPSLLARGIQVLHYGYREATDRRAKYDRYRVRGGHSRGHVESILTPPQLTVWSGKAPLRG